MLQVRENEIWLRNNSDDPAYLRTLGNIADDAMRIDVHERLYPSYTTKKIPHVTVTIAKYALLAAIARYITRVTQKDVYPWKFQLWLWLKSYLFQITTTHYSVYGRPFTIVSTISVDF